MEDYILMHGAWGQSWLHLNLTRQINQKIWVLREGGFFWRIYKRDWKGEKSNEKGQCDHHICTMQTAGHPAVQRIRNSQATPKLVYHMIFKNCMYISHIWVSQVVKWETDTSDERTIPCTEGSTIICHIFMHCPMIAKIPRNISWCASPVKATHL